MAGLFWDLGEPGVASLLLAKKLDARAPA